MVNLISYGSLMEHTCHIRVSIHLYFVFNVYNSDILDIHTVRLLSVYPNILPLILDSDHS